MYIRHGIKIDIPVDAGETIKVLIFAPASGRPLEHLSRQLILPVFYIFRQFKFRRSKCIFTVSDKRSVEPDRNAALCSLKRDKNTSALHSLRNRKIFHIACRRIKMLRNFSRPYILPAFPRILCIHIMGSIIPFHLYMCRHADIIPVSAGVIRFFKARYSRSVILCIVEFPHPVQAFPEF